MGETTNSSFCEQHQETREALKGFEKDIKSLFKLFERVEAKLMSHDEQISRISIGYEGLNKKFDNLTERIDRLIGSTRWFIGLSVTILIAVVGFTLNIIIK